LQKDKTKKDRLFIIVTAIVIANLSYLLIRNLQGIAGGAYKCPWCWVMVIGNILALVGALWLLQNYRHRRRIEREEQEREDTKIS